MSPLQKIAMGLVIVFVPAYFPADPHPEWQVYDALPDPVGWALVLWGMHALARHLDVDVASWLAWVAFAVSVPLWFPQVNHLLVPEYNDSIDVSFQWFISLPQAAFGLALARKIGREGELQQPRDRFVAGRYGVLTWAFGATIVLPVIAYGGGVEGLVNPTLVGIGLVNVVFIYYLFRVHRRSWLGGPGPLLVHPGPRESEDRPPSQ
jgi:hypothetical protein